MHRNEKLLVLGIVVCLLVGIIGYSFAYFTSSVRVEGSGAKQDISTADIIKVEYDAGIKTLALENVVPGAKASKEFNVNITPTKDQKSAKYAISLNITDNTFTKCSTKTSDNDCEVNASEVVVTLKRTIDGGAPEELVSNIDITSTTGNVNLFTEDLTFTDTDAHVYAYKIEVSFINTGSEQNHNTNKNLTGTINVAFV